MVRLFGAQTHLSAPEPVVQTGTFEVLLDVQVFFTEATVALVIVVLTLGSGFRMVSARLVFLVLHALLVGTRARGLQLLSLVSDTVLGHNTIRVELQVFLLDTHLSRTGAIGQVVLLFGVLVLFTDLFINNQGAVRLVNVIVTLTEFLTFRGEQKLILGGVFALNRVGTGAGGVDVLVFPSLALRLNKRR